MERGDVAELSGGLSVGQQIEQADFTLLHKATVI